jgi:hypothetical protein
VTDLLPRIDALVLAAYNFPPRLELKALNYVRGRERPVPSRFGEYDVERLVPIRLAGGRVDYRERWEKKRARRDDLAQVGF